MVGIKCLGKLRWTLYRSGTTSPNNTSDGIRTYKNVSTAYMWDKF